MLGNADMQLLRIDYSIILIDQQAPCLSVHRSRWRHAFTKSWHAH